MAETMAATGDWLTAARKVSLTVDQLETAMDWMLVGGSGNMMAAMKALSWAVSLVDLLVATLAD